MMQVFFFLSFKLNLSIWQYKKDFFNIVGEIYPNLLVFFNTALFTGPQKSESALARETYAHFF